jgi:hypothetical protein
MNNIARLICLAIVLGLTGCFASNQDWTQKPSTKTDYVPGQHYQLLTNVFLSSQDPSPTLFKRPVGDSDSMLDTGTRLRVTTVHYSDSLKMGPYTTVRAEVATGPFKGRNCKISLLSESSHAFLARDPSILMPVDASTPDPNTNHFAWAAGVMVNYRGEYTLDWWRSCKVDPEVVLPLRFLVHQAQNAVLLASYRDAATAEAKAYALAGLKILDDPGFPALAKQLIDKSPSLNTYHDCEYKVEPTASVIARMQKEAEIVCRAPSP